MKYVIAKEKRFYTRGRRKGIKVSQLLNFQPFFMIVGDHWNYKGVIIWLHEREGDLKDTHRNTQNAALNVHLFYNNF